MPTEKTIEVLKDIARSLKTLAEFASTGSPENLVRSPAACKELGDELACKLDDHKVLVPMKCGHTAKIITAFLRETLLPTHDESDS